MPMPATERWPLPQSATEWEDMVCDALRIRFGYQDFQRHGRSGQRQNAVDIFGFPDGKLIGAECKLVKKADFRDLQHKVKQAESFMPVLQKYYYVVSTERDANFQQQLRIFNQDRLLSGKFEVVGLFFDDVCQELSRDTRCFQKYFSLYLPQKRKEFSHNTIALCGSKGGIGRTSLTLLLGLALNSLRKSVLLVDAGGSSSYIEAVARRARKLEIPFPKVERGGLSRVDRDGPRYGEWRNQDEYRRQARSLLLRISDFSKQYDYVIIDCEKDIEQIDWVVEGGVGRIILPCSDSCVDLWGVEKSASTLRHYLAQEDSLQGCILFYQARTRGRHFMRAQEDIEKWGVPLLRVVLESADLYHMSTALGQSLFDIAPTSWEARQLARLLQELGLPVPYLPSLPQRLTENSTRRAKRNASFALKDAVDLVIVPCSAASLGYALRRQLRVSTDMQVNEGVSPASERSHATRWAASRRGR